MVYLHIELDNQFIGYGILMNTYIKDTKAVPANKLYSFVYNLTPSHSYSVPISSSRWYIIMDSNDSLNRRQSWFGDKLHLSS